MALGITSRVSQGWLILVLFGKLDFTVKEYFLNTMKDYENGQEQLLIDLQNVSLMDSAGLGMLASFTKRCREVNQAVNMKIVNPRGQVRDCLLLTNFSALIPVVDSDPEYSTFTNIPT